MSTAIQLFNNIPKLSLAPLFSPIEKCERIRKAIPELPTLYIKRDDFIGPLVWGNKLRKLAYTLAHAKAQNAATIITYGGIQSNHARITAQVSRRLGFKCILVLDGTQPEKPQANFLINHLMGIEIVYVASRQDRHPKMLELAALLKEKGQIPYCIPLGASDDIGSWGFVDAMAEIIQQQNQMGIQFSHIIHSGSSGGTQAGLLVGKALFQQHHLNIISISADDPAKDISESVMKAVLPMMEYLQMPKELQQISPIVDDTYTGDGYALPFEQSIVAFDQFAQHEGIILDHTYTAKTAAAIIDYSRKGFFKPSDKVLFWHTGGLLNLFK